MAESWQTQLKAQAHAATERELERSPRWTVRFTNPRTISQVWAVRYTREMYDAGVQVAEDLSLMSTCYESRIVSDFRNCEDGIHVLCEFLPPIESLSVRPKCMSGVIAALRRCGYHAKCYDGSGKHYEF